jgi:predicted O-methyltransferase YrrM
MNDINFVEMHRYQAIERMMYDKIKIHKPTTIIELGHGSGAVTTAMALALKELNSNGKIYSYDINGVQTYTLSNVGSSALTNIKQRNLLNFVEFIPGDIFDTWMKNLFKFDFLLIDIDNTWDKLYDILIKNKFINQQIKNGAVVFIEGGDHNHPRINNNTLNEFNKKFDKKIFEMNYLTGSGRTSISELKL